ncbi:Herc2, partial [Symbiodinium sp. KB8]
VDAIRRGLARVIPPSLLSLLGWRELEVHVCGRPVIDVALLKANTSYSGCSASDPHIAYFWEAMEEFTPKERAMYLRFVWGRSRLPLTSAGFFSIELPAYTSKEKLKEKLSYAFTNCLAIDTDYNPDGAWSDNEE